VYIVASEFELVIGFLGSRVLGPRGLLGGRHLERVEVPFLRLAKLDEGGLIREPVSFEKALEVDVLALAHLLLVEPRTRLDRFAAILVLYEGLIGEV